MQPSVRTAIAGAAALLLSLPGAAEASFVGRSFDATYRYPDVGTVYPFATWTPSTFTVGGGTETVGAIEGVTNLVTDFSATQISILFETVLNAPIWNISDFNGPFFALTSPGTLGIASVSVNPATTMAGFDAARVLVTDTAIGLNWNGLGYVDGTEVVIDVTFRNVPVPEPAPLALLLLGLAGLAALRRTTVPDAPRSRRA